MSKESSKLPTRVSLYGLGGGVGTTTLTLALANALADRLQLDVFVLVLGQGGPKSEVSVVPNPRVTVSATPDDESGHQLTLIDHGSVPMLFGEITVGPDSIAAAMRTHQLVGEGETLVYVKSTDGPEPYPIEALSPQSYMVLNSWVKVREPILRGRLNAAYQLRLSEGISAHFEELGRALADELAGFDR